MTHLILYIPGTEMHSNFEDLSGKNKNKLLSEFAQNHDGKPLQIGYSGGTHVGQIIGTRVQPDRVGLVLEWHSGIEVTRLEGADLGK